MAKLDQVIGEILNSITLAGHEANIFTASLVEDYKENEILKVFPLPGSEVKEVEIQLKFAINSLSKTVADYGILFSTKAQKIAETSADVLNPVGVALLSEEIHLFFSENKMRFEAGELARKLSQELISGLLLVARESNELEAIRKGLPLPLKQALRGAVIEILGKFSAGISAQEDLELDIEVSSEKLKGKPVSEIKLVAGIDKHAWAVLEDEREEEVSRSATVHNDPEFLI